MNDIVSATGPLMPADPFAALLRGNAEKLTGPPGGTSVEKAAKDFESILLYRLLEEMKRTIPESGLLETGASKQVQDIFWYHLAQELAEQGGLGLWREIRGQLAGPGEPAAAAVREPPR